MTGMSKHKPTNVWGATEWTENHNQDDKITKVYYESIYTIHVTKLQSHVPLTNYEGVLQPHYLHNAKDDGRNHSTSNIRNKMIDKNKFKWITWNNFSLTCFFPSAPCY